jgi:hypothetical protein
LTGFCNRDETMPQNVVPAGFQRLAEAVAKVFVFPKFMVLVWVVLAA